VVADEENGTLDLLLAHPVSRTALFLSRVLAFAVATLAILVLSWLGFLAATPWSRLGLGWWALARPYVSLAAVLLFFGALALLLSLLLPARRTAAMTAGIVLLVSYFLTTLARLDQGLEPAARYSPISYYQSGDAIDGLNGRWLLGLLAAAGLFTAMAWWLFQRRDIRVVGEGGWRWPILTKTSTKFENRNKFKARSRRAGTNDQNVLDFLRSNFGFVSDFGFRASCFPKNEGPPPVTSPLEL
jgi:ABC-2 type transport system permease protein